MRLITYTVDGSTKLGAWIEGDLLIADLAAAALAEKVDLVPFSSMQALIEAGPIYWDIAKSLVSRAAGSSSTLKTEDVVLRSPLPRPPHIRDCISFEQHLRNATQSSITLMCQAAPDPEAMRRKIEESGAAEFPEVWWKRAIYYNANPFTVTDPGVDIRCPSYCKLMDYELEFAAIIGKAGHDIARDQAADHIFGYTIYNDWSARDEQLLVMSGKLGPGKGKDFDQSITLGPCIVTVDALEDPYNLTMTARVNGEEWSRGSSSTMYHQFPDLIADLTRSQGIYPGEVLGSGTVGMGSGLESLRFLKNNDVVELEVEGLGILRNRVVMQ